MIFTSFWNNRSLVAGVLILIIFATGLLASVESLRAWVAVSVLALGPAAALWHFSKAMPRTLSQTIHQARR